MTRRLLLIRHAHAGHEQGIPDHERALSEHGRAQARALAPLIGPHLTEPVHVVVSSAVRAHQTWSIVHESLATFTGGWLTDPRMYRAIENDVAALLAALRESPAGASTVAMVGHDPGFTSLVELVTAGEGAVDAWRAMRPHLRKAAAAVVEIPTAWADIAPGCGVLVDVVRPADGGG